MPEVYYGPQPVLDPQPDWIDFKQVFALGPSRDVWVRFQRNEVWQEWMALDGDTLDGWLVVDRFRGSPINVFVRDQADQTVQVRQISPSLTAWSTLGLPPGAWLLNGAFAVGHAVVASGEHLELYGCSPSEGLWKRQQSALGWGAWQNVALPAGLVLAPGEPPAIAVGRVPAGDLVLFLADGAGTVWMRTSDGIWSAIPTEGAGADPVVQIGTRVDWSSFDLLVFATTLNGILNYKVWSASGPSEWRRIDQSALPAGGVWGIPAFMAGTLCAQSGDSLWITTPDAAFSGGGWSPWQSLGHPPGHALSGFAMALDSRSDRPKFGLQVFAAASDRNLWTRLQHAPGGPFKPWTLLAHAPPATRPAPPPRPRPPLPIGDLPGKLAR
jgi:hypothetical protein